MKSQMKPDNAYPSDMQYVIIGAGPAGVVAAETLRQQDAAADITLVGEEPEPPYSRMAIPYHLIENIDEAGCYLRDAGGHYDNQAIKVVRQRVDAIDIGDKQLKLSDGSRVAYDRLLIATGSSPVKPPIPGLDLPQVSNCWTLEDARAIIGRANSGATVVLIGAGFIGCIILEALVKRGVNLHVVETGNRMVPRMLNEKAGGILRDWCVNKGVNVHTSCSVASIADAGNDQVKVSIDNGEEITADLVISAAGVRSNVSFLEGSGIECEQGILVDDHMQTNVTDVYAAGDVAQGRDFSSGEREVQAIQPTATDHGRIAAMNMAGVALEHQGSLNMNVLDTLGLISCSFGHWMGVEGGEQAELYNPGDNEYLSLQFDGNHLIGATAVGKTQHIGVLRGLIETRVDLGVWKDKLLADPLLIMEAYMANTQDWNTNNF